jgi:hypothetical protein
VIISPTAPPPLGIAHLTTITVEPMALVEVPNTVPPPEDHARRVYDAARRPFAAAVPAESI